jgi:hypothetical protein
MSYKHGHRSSGCESPTHMSWRCCKDRTTRKSSNSSQYYRGAMEVRVCDRWKGLNGFANFLSDMGERPPGTTLSRIDPWGDYTPDNCRWDDAKAQANNVRPLAPIKLMGKDTTMGDLVKKGVPADTIHYLMRSRYKNRRQQVPT